MTDYFPHDYNARNDPKIAKMQMVLGYEGIGIYWSLVEYIYEQGGYIFENECESIAFALRIEPAKLQTVLDNFQLFCKKDEKYFSKAILIRLKHIKAKIAKAKEAADKRWEKQRIFNNANALPPQSVCNAIKERKGKEVKERKEKNTVGPLLAPFGAFEQATLKLWNAFCLNYPQIPAIKAMSKKRRDKLKARYAEDTFRDAFEKATIFDCIEKQGFLMGKNDRNWTVNFDWLLENDTNYLKVLECQYLKDGAR